MKDLLSQLLLPIPILFLLILSAICCFKTKRKKTAYILIGNTILILLAITTFPIPNLLVKSLECHYSQISDGVLKDLPDSCNIMVLGSGHSDDKDLSPNNQLSLKALGRLMEGIRIQRSLPGSRLILSGYEGRSQISQAMVLYRTALLLSVDSSSMQILPTTINTYMEATEYIKVYGKENHLVLVTCAIHMPRAMICFNEAGIKPLAAPTNFILKKGTRKNPWKWFPSSRYPIMMDAVIHEYLGIAWTELQPNK